MIERGTGPKSLMEGSKGSRELGGSLTMCVCCLVFLSVLLSEGGASHFIDEGDGFTRVSGLGSVLYLASLPILMGAKGR